MLMYIDFAGVVTEINAALARDDREETKYWCQELIQSAMRLLDGLPPSPYSWAFMGGICFFFAIMFLMENSLHLQ